MGKVRRPGVSVGVTEAPNYQGQMNVFIQREKKRSRRAAEKYDEYFGKVLPLKIWTDKSVTLFWEEDVGQDSFNYI